MHFDLIFTQIYPMINYFCLKSVFSSISRDKRDTIGLEETIKIFTLIFLPMSTLFILFLLFLGGFWGITQKLDYDKIIEGMKYYFSVYVMLYSTKKVPME